MVDAIVVGAGPAGSVCARELARAGLAVTLVERAIFPRRKVCGEYLNGGAVATLEALGLGAAVRAVARPLAGLRIVPPATSAVEIPFPSPALACERASLDDVLLHAALAAGATHVRGRVEDVLRRDGRAAGVVIRDDAGERRELFARFIVGADGTGSIVARKLGLARASQGARRFAVGGHYAGFGSLDGYIEMYVGSGAYFAINPLGADRANVMVVVGENDLAMWSGAVDDGMRGKAVALGRGHRDLAVAERLGPRVSVGPLAFDVTSAAAPGALLVGDAAGFLNPFTGQGVFLALRGGRDAAAAIVAVIRNRTREGAAFAGYATDRARDFAIRRRLTRVVGLIVDHPWLAARAADRLRRRPQAGATMLAALAGSIAPERALSAAFLGRLIV